jgi:hypothetical protein
MLIISATLIAGSSHEKFPAGTEVPAVLFADASEIDEAEDRLAPVLHQRGWSKLSTERYKTVVARPDGSNPQLAHAYDEALSCGVGYVLFP